MVKACQRHSDHLQRYREYITGVDLIGRTSHNWETQGTLGIVPTAVLPTDPLPFSQVPAPGPTPVGMGLHAVRWPWSSTGPDQQVNFDPIGLPFSGTADRFPGVTITLKRVHFWINKGSHAGGYFVLRKNGADVKTWNISQLGEQENLDVTYTVHADPVSEDLGAWYINGTAAGGTTSGLITVEFDIINEV